MDKYEIYVKKYFCGLNFIATWAIANEGTRPNWVAIGGLILARRCIELTKAIKFVGTATKSPTQTNNSETLIRQNNKKCESFARSHVFTREKSYHSLHE
ncbi:MAG TPA: hypothetical protein V6C91_21730 [Coleofasciculaceae cyanobacterium]